MLDFTISDLQEDGMSIKVIAKFILLLVICLSIECLKKDQIDPTVYIINPQDNSTVSGAVRIKAVAMDNKEVTCVEFFINNVRKAVDSTASNSVFEYVWNTGSESPGTKTILAKAYDQAGNVGESPSIIVTIATTGPTYHSGEIVSPQIWTKAHSPHIVIDSVIVNALLTIEQGTIIQFLRSDSIDTLYPELRPAMIVSEQGDIIARGNNNEPIIFTSIREEPNSGDWEGLIFEHSDNSNTIIDNCIIEYAHKGINLNDKIISVTNTLIQLCSSNGLYCQSGHFSQFNNNTITQNNDFPISIIADAVYTLGVNNYLQGNGAGSSYLIDAVEVQSGDITENGNWHNQGVPYLIHDPISLEDEITLTIENGCVLAFSDDGGFHMEANGTSLNASGVTFTSEQALEPYGGNHGDWDGIYVEDGSLNLQDCIIEYGGNGDEAVILIQNSQEYPSISIDHCIIRYNEQSGISLDVQEIGEVNITNTIIIYNNEYPVILYNAEYIRALGPGNNFVGNGYDMIWIPDGGEVLTSGIWHDCGVPYFIEQHIMIEQDWQNYPPTITIMPGVIMEFGLYTSLIIEDGALIADGSASQIVFTNAEEGIHWGGIVFDEGTDDNLTRLNQCIIQNGGYTSYGHSNIYCQNSAPRITNCDICYSSGWGMTLHNSALNPDTLRRYNHFYANDSGDIRTLFESPKQYIKSISKTVKTKSTSPNISQLHKNDKLIHQKTIDDKTKFIQVKEYK